MDILSVLLFTPAIILIFGSLIYCLVIEVKNVFTSEEMASKIMIISIILSVLGIVRLFYLTIVNYKG